MPALDRLGPRGHPRGATFRQPRARRTRHALPPIRLTTPRQPPPPTMGVKLKIFLSRTTARTNPPWKPSRCVCTMKPTLLPGSTTTSGTSSPAFPGRKTSKTSRHLPRLRHLHRSERPWHGITRRCALCVSAGGFHVFGNAMPTGGTNPRKAPAEAPRWAGDWNGREVYPIVAVEIHGAGGSRERCGRAAARPYGWRRWNYSLCLWGWFGSLSRREAFGKK